MKLKILLFVAVVSCVIVPASVYAQETRDTILGINVVWAALAITAIGIGLRTFIGFAGKPAKEFNPQLLLTSIIIGFFASIQLVIASIQHIPEDAGQLVYLSVITGEIATVMGIDAGVKGAGKRAQDKFNQMRGNDVS